MMGKVELERGRVGFRLMGCLSWKKLFSCYDGFTRD